MRGEAADALDHVEVAALAHPARQEVQAEARVAHIDKVRARVGERHHARLVLQQLGHAVVTDVQEAAEERRLEILIEADVEHHVERIAML